MNNIKSLITKPLGLFGWSHLEPVILAALATESPMLLIGKHGSAKSFLLERLAEALNLEFRCYNASLINYDDLVGIPIPVNNNSSLDYISNPNSIWDAEVVFIDELNRTKPELQNKLFPIIYEKRVQGQKLEKLKYRWSAMNPPISEEDDDDELSYLGASPLDPALADRFPFIVEVPSWFELNEDDKKNILLDSYKGRHEFIVDIHELIKQTKTNIEIIIKNEQEYISKYIISLMSLLNNQFCYISTRRATMLQNTLIGIIAAERVLSMYDKREVKLSNSICLHIQNVIPDLANKKIDKTLLINIALQALKMANLEDGPEKNIININDPIERVKYAIINANLLETSTICDVITTSLASVTNPIRRGLALICYLAFRKKNNIYAAVMETIAKEIRPVLHIKYSSTMEVHWKKKIANKVDVLMNGVDKNWKYYSFLNNLLYSFLPDDYQSEDEVQMLYDFFLRTCKEVDL